MELDSEVQNVPVVTIDGPSGSGKGTIAQMVAERLGFNLLDSGALYRVLALSSQRHGVASDNEDALVVIAEHMDVQFIAGKDYQGIDIVLEGDGVTNDIRNEEIGKVASQIAVLPNVREALLTRQRAFRELPGLVADGRDMGTVVFPSADLKVFLTASAEERALRRYKQLKEKGYGGTLARLVEDVQLRDERDMSRKVAPLAPADDAVYIDSSALSIVNVLDKVIAEAQKKGLV
ncbi:MAG: (d)CMP kinase [Gammaproteobacteria bacterium]|nr:(d)CMP kinase [Gammaproteobacteria bacterium]